MKHENDALVIVEGGDLILNIRRHEGDEATFSYRVETARLRHASPYFEVLLSERFSEGASVKEIQQALLSRYKSIAEAPTQELPRVEIVEIGRTSKVSSIKEIMADFLRILHGGDLAVAKPPLVNVANLAIVADRFDCLPAVAAYCKMKGLLQKLDAKTRVKSVEEERIRQRILVGALLDWSPWVTTYSKRLILQGSKWWESLDEVDTSTALWNDLPHGIEDELRYRREMVLETLGSIQTYFLKLYTSGDRQCKLGYDTSLACDSFQLGQMIKFLSKTGTLRLQCAVIDTTEDSLQYLGDIDRLTEDLRKCPNYQIDGNHTHCGLRDRMLPLLDWVQFWLEKDGGSPDLGLCLECWKQRRKEYAWCEAKRPLVWQKSRALANGNRLRRGAAISSPQCSHRQFEVREMFTAAERDWS